MSDGTPEPRFYGLEDTDRLTAVSLDEVVQFNLDEWAYGPLPEHLEVCGYTPQAITPNSYTTRVLGNLIEMLDEEYADPDKVEATKPTQTMKEAEQAFIEAVLAEYKPWLCDLTTRETVHVPTWIRENPEWLDNFKDGIGKPELCRQCGQKEQIPLIRGSDGRPRCMECTRILKCLGRLR